MIPRTKLNCKPGACEVQGRWTKVHYFSSAGTIDDSRKIVLTGWARGSGGSSFAYHHRHTATTATLPAVSFFSFLVPSALCNCAEGGKVVRYLSSSRYILHSTAFGQSLQHKRNTNTKFKHSRMWHRSLIEYSPAVGPVE